MSIKSIPNSAKVFFLILIIGTIILINLPKDECGNTCGRGSFIPFLIFLSMIIIPLLFGTVELIKNKISLTNFGGLIILLVIPLIVFILIFSSVECIPRWRKTILGISQLRAAQTIFYSQNNRYADTQEELISAGFGQEKLKDEFTGKELTDKDGQGIEGGDNDPNTWSVAAYIPSRQVNKWCRLVREGYWYACNQDGCEEE